MSNRRRLPRPRGHFDRLGAGAGSAGHLDCGCGRLAVIDVTCPACGHVMRTPPMPTSGSVGDLREVGAMCLRCGEDFETLAAISALV